MFIIADFLMNYHFLSVYVKLQKKILILLVLPNLGVSIQIDRIFLNLSNKFDASICCNDVF